MRATTLCYSLQVFGSDDIPDGSCKDFLTALRKGKETGPVEKVFGDGKFTGELERIVIACCPFQVSRFTSDTAFAETSAAVPGSWQCLVVYKAFGTKKLLWLKTSRAVAYVAMTLEAVPGRTRPDSLLITWFQRQRG